MITDTDKYDALKPVGQDMMHYSHKESPMGLLIAIYSPVQPPHNIHIVNEDPLLLVAFYDNVGNRTKIYNGIWLEPNRGFPGTISYSEQTEHFALL